MSATQTIIMASKREDPFARVPKQLLEDASLSWKAKGVLAYLIGKPSNWRVRITDIVNRGTDGEKAIRSAMVELRRSGYAKLEAQREGGRIVAWLIKVADMAVFSPDAQNRQVEPDAQNLHVEKLQVENRQRTKKEPNENESVTRTISKEEGAKPKKAPNPDLLPTSEPSRRISTLFHRKPTTEWAPKDIKTFKGLAKRKVLTSESLDLIETYYAKERAKGDNGRHRRDLSTFLNNFDGELDRATVVVAANGQTPKPSVRVSL